MAFMRHNNNRRHNNNHHRGNRPGYQGGQNQQSTSSNGTRRPTNRINQVFESNGPDGRIRGTAQQIVEKYATMARDAQTSGDKVLMLNYLQHAEHYQRLLNEIMEENGMMEREREQYRQQQAQQPDVSTNSFEGGAAADGFVSNEQPQAGEQAAPQPEQQQRYEQRPRRDDRPRDDNRRDDTRRDDRPRDDNRRDYNEQPQRRSQRPQQQDDAEDDNALPSFLQVPITEKPVVEKKPATPAAADIPASAAAPPVRRAGRPRRAAQTDNDE